MQSENIGYHHRSALPEHRRFRSAFCGERSHRVDEQDFYQLLDKDGIADDIHLFNDKLREWEDHYNYHRPHGALDGQTPYERLMAKSTASLSTKS